MTQNSKEQLGAYNNYQRDNETTRETDARALLSCASRLEQARNNDDREAYAAAIRHNQQLWTVFQVCLTEPDNELPLDIKLLLLNLSRYVDKVSFRALGEYNPELLSGLININRQIAAGLSVKPTVAETAKANTNVGTTTAAAPPQAPVAPGSVMTSA